LDWLRASIEVSSKVLATNAWTKHRTTLLYQKRLEKTLPKYKQRAP